MCGVEYLPAILSDEELKDAGGNVVSGTASLLTADIVTVAKPKNSIWKGNNDGTYTTTYTAITPGTGLKAKVKLGGWSSGCRG